MRHSAYISVALYTLWGLALTAASNAIASEPMSRTLVDFAEASVAEQWRSVNDNVMGGVSDGGFRITDDKTLVFSGNLSLGRRRAAVQVVNFVAAAISRTAWTG